MIHNPGTTKRTAHYDRRLFFAREQYQNGRAIFYLVKTEKMMADIMTKVTDRAKFFLCRNFIMRIT